MRSTPLFAFVLGLGAAACDTPCPELTRVRPDDEAINGVSADQLDPVLLTADPGLPLVWENGDETTVEASVTPILGTARLSQRSDCVEACPTRYSLAMACGPDQLALDATIRVQTQDGLIDEELPATLKAMRTADGIVWSLYAEFLLDGAESPIDPREVGSGACIGSAPVRDEGVIIWMGGVNGEMNSVTFGHSATIELGKDDANCVSGLGAMPEPP